MGNQETPRLSKMGIDIGGKLTDVNMLDEVSGEVYNGKLLSTPKDLSEGVTAIFSRMLKETAIDPKDIISAIHGTTVATNAIIERKGSKTALLTSRSISSLFFMM